MDGTRFDNWTRTFSRRKAMAVLGATGVAAMAKGVPATAQRGQTTCTMTLQALTTGGPSAGQAYDGVLEITFSPEGAIDDGSFTPPGGVAASVVGQIDRRAISLRLTFADGQALVLTGVGENDLDVCSGALSGVFGGPQLGDTGSWQIDPAQTQRGAASGGAAATSTPAMLAPTPTPCPGMACDDPFVLDPNSCQCACPESYEACGPVCCPGGSTCTDPNNGECSCPSGTELCGDTCVASCASGTYLDPATCMCGPCNLSCDDDPCTSLELDTCACVTICGGSAPYCCNGLCYDTEPIMCNGACVPVEQSQTDPDHCGPNCEACPTGMSCSDGHCICISGVAYCAGVGCVDTMIDPNNCGSCGNVCPDDNPTCYTGLCGKEG